MSYALRLDDRATERLRNLLSKNVITIEVLDCIEQKLQRLSAGIQAFMQSEGIRILNRPMQGVSFWCCHNQVDHLVHAFYWLFEERELIVSQITVTPYTRETPCPV